NHLTPSLVPHHFFNFFVIAKQSWLALKRAGPYAARRCCRACSWRALPFFAAFRANFVCTTRSEFFGSRSAAARDACWPGSKATHSGRSASFLWQRPDLSLHIYAYLTAGMEWCLAWRRASLGALFSCHFARLIWLPFRQTRVPAEWRCSMPLVTFR